MVIYNSYIRGFSRQVVISGQYVDLFEKALGDLVGIGTRQVHYHKITSP